MKHIIYIKLGAGALLVLFPILLGIWSIDVYRSAVSGYRQSINECLQQSISEELIMRRSDLGENIHVWYTPYTDTSPFVIKTIRTEDTTFQVQIEKNDLTAMPRIRQYMFKSFLPLNVNRLDSLLKLNMAKNSISFKGSYIEYCDLKKKSVISDNKPAKAYDWNIQLDTIPLDILNTIGVKAYASVPFPAILKAETSRIAWLVAFVLLVLIGLHFLLRTIRRERREKQRLVHDIHCERAEKESLLQTVATQQEKDQMRVKFLLKMEHEIGKPIASAIIHTTALPEQLEFRQINDAKVSVEKTIFHLERLQLQYRQFGYLIRGGEDTLSFTKKTVSLLDLCKEMKQKYQTISHKKVLVVVPRKDITISTDGMHLCNVFENLLENSVKYSGEKVRIEIKTVYDKKNQQVLIRFRDNGWGIPEADLSHIFNNYYRVQAHRMIQPNLGSGIGLSYVKTIAEKLGGSINVSSEEGVFTEFVLAFPTS